MSRSGTTKTVGMSKFATVVYTIFLLVCSTVKSNEQGGKVQQDQPHEDEIEADKALIDINLTDFSEVEPKHASYNDILTEYNEGESEQAPLDEILSDINGEQFEYTTDETFVEYYEVESEHASKDEQVDYNEVVSKHTLNQEILADHNEGMSQHTSSEEIPADSSEEMPKQHASSNENLAGHNEGVSQHTSSEEIPADRSEEMPKQHASSNENLAGHNEGVSQHTSSEEIPADRSKEMPKQHASSNENLAGHNEGVSQHTSSEEIPADRSEEMPKQHASSNENLAGHNEGVSQHTSSEEIPADRSEEMPKQHASSNENLAGHNEGVSQHKSSEEIPADRSEEMPKQHASSNENLAGHNEGVSQHTSSEEIPADRSEEMPKQHASSNENLAGHNEGVSQHTSSEEIPADRSEGMPKQHASSNENLAGHNEGVSQHTSSEEIPADRSEEMPKQHASSNENLAGHNEGVSQHTSSEEIPADRREEMPKQHASSNENLAGHNEGVSQHTSSEEIPADRSEEMPKQHASSNENLAGHDEVMSDDELLKENLADYNEVQSEHVSNIEIPVEINEVQSEHVSNIEIPVENNEAESQHTVNDGSVPDSLSNFIHVVDYPEILVQDSKIVVEYHCEENSIVVLDLTVMLMDFDTYSTVYSKAWRCYGQGLEGNSHVKSIFMTLPDTLAYRPDYFLKSDTVWQVNWCKLRAWLIDEATWYGDDSVDVLANSRSRDIHKMTVLPPYSRPYKNADCTIWIWPYVQTLHTLSDFQTCAVEEESVTLLDYPVAFSGHYYGIVKELSPFIDWRLERDRIQRRHFPQFTVELWVYILDYCPLHHLSPANACGLFIHMNSEGLYRNPAIFINKDGNIQIDMKGSNQFIGMKSTDIVPKNKWTRILFSFYERMWFLHVNHGPDLKDGFWTTHTYTEDIYMDDTEGLMNLGGIDWSLGSFVGYMGRVVYHRRRSLMPSQLSVPGKSHSMFELHLARRQEKCDNFLSWMDSAVDVFQKYRRYIIQQQGDTCPHEPLNFFMQFLSNPEGITTCPPINPYNFSQYRHVSGLLRKAVLANSLSNFLKGDLEAYSRKYMNASQTALQEIAVDLLETAKLIVNEKGLGESTKVLHLLKQASCLGNDDAMYSLAVMLNNGVGCDPDELQSLAFFMLGTLNRHLLSVMALGHRHVMGNDGAPVDMDVAYMYYKQVADMTRTMKEIHMESGIATESIHLTDEARIQAQTSEAGDLFIWLKNQAEKGVASAQSQLGTMLYHGSQGIKRNLQTAINIFKDGAEMGNSDAMFNYGIMQYRGMGAEMNRTEGKRMLLKAAELNNPNAVSALGWVALEIDKNYTHAVEMFHLAKKLGHIDSGYYLAFMNHFGLVPNKTYDMDNAFEEYTWSAKKGQIDAGIMLSFLLSRGTPRYKRNKEQAIDWARFIAEKNANLATPLRDALNAFRDGNYDLAIYLYLMLADTGLEVGSFNLAYLCEHNKNDVGSFMAKECVWRHYNMSTQRESHFVDAYAYIKMGDYYWYGCEGNRNLHEAASHYSQAALKGNPQALFNLAFMVEEGAHISPVIWWMLHLNPQIYTNKVTLLLELYARCQESGKSEAFIPCYLAWIRIWILDVWNHYYIYMKISSFMGMIVAMATTSYLLYKYFQQRQADKDKEEEEQKAVELREAEKKREVEVEREIEGERKVEEEEENERETDERNEIDEKREAEEEQMSEKEDEKIEVLQNISS